MRAAFNIALMVACLGCLAWFAHDMRLAVASGNIVGTISEGLGVLVCTLWVIYFVAWFDADTRRMERSRGR